MKKNIFVPVLMIAGVCSCVKASQPAANYRYFIPGECIASTELNYYSPQDFSDIDQVLVDDRVSFGFTLNLSNTQKVLEYPPSTYRVYPSEEIFNSYGNNKELVYDGFVNAVDDYLSSLPMLSANYDLATILYTEGISLVADSEFAGYQPGENLAPLLTCVYRYQSAVPLAGDTIIASPLNARDLTADAFDIPLNYMTMTGAYGLSFAIPIGDHKVVEERVKIELNIPVKVVMYLTWLNDRISNPNAPILYKEEVLHCTFTTIFGVR